LPENSHSTDSDLLNIVEATDIGKVRRFRSGEIVFWQGDPVENIFIVKKGAIKEYAISPEGKAYIYRILGPGELAGAVAYLLGRDHEEIAQALGDTDVLTLPPRDFDDFLSHDGHFSMLVMKELAQRTSSMESRARDLGFLDVQKRLLQNLMELAQRHGVVTDKGVKIDLDITHQDIGALVAANRCTITNMLNALRQQGFLWNEGRHLVIMSPDQVDTLDNLRQAVIQGHDWEAKQWAHEVVEKGVALTQALDTLAGAMREVERMFIQETVELSDVLWRAQVMKDAMAIIEPEIDRAGSKVRSLGTVVIGTVYGDIHDIGKNTVAMFLVARGFKVIDLGTDVAVSDFVDAVKIHRPDILAMSALLTVTLKHQGEVVKALEVAGIRHRVKIMVGGTPATPRFAGEIRADGYASTAREAAELAWRLINS
jgi:5-methyltetrahydrofolate--homocysteine methyltransferase